MPSYQEWSTLVALSMSNVVEQIDRYVFTVSPIPYIDYSSYGYSLLAGTMFSVTYCFGSITISSWNETLNMNRVTVVAVSCLLSSIALVCVPFVRTFLHLALLRILMGIAQAPITTFSSSLIKDCFEEQWRGIAYGTFGSGTFFGFALALSMGTLAYDKSGWQAAYIFFGLIGIVYAAFLHVFAKDPDAAGGGNGEVLGHAAAAYSNIDRQEYEQLQKGSTHHSQADSSNSIIPSPLQSSGGDSKLVMHAGGGSDDETRVYNDGVGGGGDDDEGDGQPQCHAVVRLVYKVGRYCLDYPSIILTCFACLIRFCGGYAYAYYVGIFFSTLYHQQSLDDGVDVSGDTVTCTYSYEPGNATAGALAGDAACSSDSFPYCIDGSCAQLNPTPWHNVGMPHSQFETAFAVATTVGSVSGCLLGGMVGDWVSSQTSFGISGRMLVAGISLLIAAPMYVVMFSQLYPLCFVGLFFGGMFGEIYYSQAMAVLAAMVPKKLFTVLTSVYTSLLIGAASNATVLVPAVRAYFEARYEDDQVTFTIDAAPTYTAASSSSNAGDSSEQTFTETISGSQGLQGALTWLVSGTYVVAGAIFLLSIPLVKRDLARAV